MIFIQFSSLPAAWIAALRSRWRISPTSLRGIYAHTSLRGLTHTRHCEDLCTHVIARTYAHTSLRGVYAHTSLRGVYAHTSLRGLMHTRHCEERSDEAIHSCLSNSRKWITSSLCQFYRRSDCQFPIPNSQFPIPNSWFIIVKKCTILFPWTI